MTKPCHRDLEQLCEGQNVQSFRLTHMKTTARKKVTFEIHSRYEYKRVNDILILTPHHCRRDRKEPYGPFRY